METEKLSDHPTSKGSHKCVDKQNTIRFALELKESNDKYFPEFSFRELLRSAVPKVGETPEKEDPPFDDEDDEKLQALAKKFEDKYGTKQKSKKKRRERIEDLVDVTYGYDETDSFVDNSEAYDELIPADWTTEHGGFYINQGGLSFKPTSSDDSDIEDFKGKKRKTPKKIRDPNKVRKVKDSGEKERKRKHLTPSGEKEKKPHKIRLVSGDKEKKHKKKLNLSGSSNTASPSSTLAIKLIATNPQAALSSIASTTTMAAVASPTGSTVSLASSSLMSVGANTLTPGPSTEGSPQSAEKSSVKMEVSSENQVPLTKAVTSETSLFSSEGNSNLGVANSTLAINQNGLSASEGGGEDSTFVPKLPQYLPLSVEACVQKLKQAANDAVDEGKCKFFNKDVNQLLLEIETKSRELSCRVRSGIYDYLAFYLPCTKETLLKRAKKLLLTDQAGRLREPMAKLRAAVNKVMPEQIKAFEEEVRHHVEEQSKQNEAKPGTEIQSSDDKKKELFKSAMEVEEDGEKVEEAVTPTEPMIQTPTEEKTKKPSPKRKFVWTDELRDLLSDVVTVKVKLFEMSKTRTTSAEEYLKEFFESEVKTLWPKGWMTSRNLFKESKTVHNRLTSAQFKPKKVPGPKKQGESPSPSDALDSSSQNVDIKEEMKVAQTSVDTTPSTNTTAVTPTSNTPSEVTVATPVVPMAAATLEQIIGSATSTVPSSTHPAIKSLPKLSADALSMLKAKLIQVNYPSGSGKVTVLTQSGNKVVSATILTAKPTSASPVSMGTITSKVPVSVGAISIKTPVSLATSKAKVPISIATITTKTPLSMAVTTTKAQVAMVTTTSKPLVSVNRLDMESRGAVTKIENTVEKRPDHRAGAMTTNGLQQQIPVCMPGQLHRTSATALPDQRMPHTASTAFPKAQYLSAAVSVSRTSAPPTRTTMKNPVTILDFADMVCADSQSDTQEILNNQMQAQQFINKSMLTANPKETPMTVPPKSPAAVVSPPRQQNPAYTGTSPSNIIRSPTQMIQQRNNMPQSNAALANMLMNCGMGTSGMPTQLQNKYIDLNTATMMAQQRQQAANTKTMLDSISAQSRMSMDMHSPSVPLTHPVISRQLSNPTQSASVYLPSNVQQPTLSMLGHANLQGKGTNPLSHLGMVPQSVPSSVINMNRSIQQQSNLVMAPNPYNQDPNHNPNGGHPQSTFMPRFS